MVESIIYVNAFLYTFELVCHTAHFFSRINYSIYIKIIAYQKQYKFYRTKE